MLISEETENAFCPTGPGGGVDATCGKGGGAAAVGAKGSKSKDLAPIQVPVDA